jgi:hypothetical protein
VGRFYIGRLETTLNIRLSAVHRNPRTEVPDFSRASLCAKHQSPNNPWRLLGFRFVIRLRGHDLRDLGTGGKLPIAGSAFDARLVNSPAGVARARRA